MKKFLVHLEKHIFQILTAIFWVGIIAFYFYYKNIHHFTNGQIAKSIYFLLKKEGIYGGLFYISIYAIRTVIFFPSSLLILLSPSLFGLPMAIIYTVLGENLSATLGYYLGKFFGKNILSDSLMNKFAFLKKKLRDDSFISILTARLVFVPFDPLSYVSGFFKAEFSGYFWGTVFGTLPSILIFAFAGAGINNIERFDLSELKIDHNYLILSGVFALISVGIVFFLRKKIKVK